LIFWEGRERKRSGSKSLKNQLFASLLIYDVTIKTRIEIRMKRIETLLAWHNKVSIMSL